MIKAKAKAIPPLPLRSLAAATRSSQDLSKICARLVQDLSKILPNVLVRGLGRGPGFDSRAARGLVPCQRL